MDEFSKWKAETMAELLMLKGKEKNAENKRQIDLLISKLDYLRADWISSWLSTLNRVSTVIPEAARLAPNPDRMRKILA